MFKIGGFIHLQIHGNSSGARLSFTVSADTLGASSTNRSLFCRRLVANVIIILPCNNILLYKTNCTDIRGLGGRHTFNRYSDAQENCVIRTPI